MKSTIARTMSAWIMLTMGLAFSSAVYPGTRIAVLSFELNDITSLPNTPAEIERTATIKPLLEQAIDQAGDYEIIHIDAGEYSAANLGFGYLFRFHDAAAALARQSGADWVIVGQHSKPSFLFSYLMAYLINVDSPTVSTRYDIEMKGTHRKVMEHGVEALAQKVHASIHRM